MIFYLFYNFNFITKISFMNKIVQTKKYQYLPFHIKTLKNTSHKLHYVKCFILYVVLLFRATYSGLYLIKMNYYSIIFLCQIIIRDSAILDYCGNHCLHSLSCVRSHASFHFITYSFNNKYIPYSFLTISQYGSQLGLTNIDNTIDTIFWFAYIYIRNSPWLY